MAIWKKTKYPGVRYREHKTRKHGLMPDKYFAIRYQKDGNREEEKLGWSSEGWTAKLASAELALCVNAANKGEPGARLREKRELKRIQDERKALEKKRLEKENLTFDQFFNETYLPIVQANRGDESIQKEIGHFKNWMLPVIAVLSLKNITPLHIEKIKKNMLEAGRSPRTVQYCLAIFRQVWNTAKAHDIVSGDSPTKKVKIPPIYNERERFLSIDEAETLLQALKERSEQVYQMAMISLHCGLRASEIFNLTWADIQIDQGLLNLRDTKAGGNAHAFMTEEIKNMFQCMVPDEPLEYVFKTRKGGRIAEVPTTFERTVKALGWNDGIKDRRRKLVFHCLRHTYASRLAEAGVDLYVIQKLMRHGSFKMTERYSHIRNESLQNAVKQMEKSMPSTGHGAGSNVITLQRAK